MSSTAAATSHQYRRNVRVTHRATDARRKARLSGIEVATLLLVALLLIAGATVTRAHSIAPVSTRTVQVNTGDTLWSIAKAHPIAGLTTAQTAEQIARDNHLDGAVLAAGTVITVPVTDSAVAPQLASR